MKESQPNIKTKEHSLEKEVNFEPNDTELVFSRMRHPVIQEQLHKILFKQEINYLRPYKEDTWNPHMPEGWTGEERFKLCKNTKTGEITDTETLEKYRKTPYPTFDSIYNDTQSKLTEIETVTNIDFSKNTPTAERMGLNWEMPWNHKKPNTKQWSIIEGHEKGHEIRRYGDLDGVFRTGFDISAVTFTAEDHAIHLYDQEQGDQEIIGQDPNESKEDFGEKYLHDYLFTAIEIAERMSQLKNYFSFSGNEIFTKSHLDYARIHYVDDTGMDNSMTLFFQGITPLTEDRFIELINNYGI